LCDLPLLLGGFAKFGFCIILQPSPQDLQNFCC